jgi:acetylornithine deacetylase/succinyl-diaminopimelate desuccinylase-like protein
MIDQHRAQAIRYAEENQGKFLENLIRFTSIPSISTSPDHTADMQRAAELVSDHLKALGMAKVQVYPTAGHPVVYGEWVNGCPGCPTMLIYGHYDVQPSEPDELWLSPPFVPTVRGDNLYGRGASDMKGQVIATLSAVEAVQRSGPLPVNIKFIIEGEEEIGSPNLTPFLESHKDLLKCDFALNPDAGMIAPDIPTIVYALRGLAYFELRVYGPEHDLHSGLFGGVVHNPAQALCELVAGMHDAQGRIMLPGFYDRVRPLTEEERAGLAHLPMNEEYYRQQTGVSQTWGEAGYTPSERIGARPTLEINGMLSGFTGKGSKTVIPAHAMAKISMRLVPDQDPAEVHQQLLRYLKERAPKTIRWELTVMAGGPASISDPHHPATQALGRALEMVWGASPVLKREGGSVPVVGDMQKILNVESVLTGFGLPDDNLHAPNEKLHLPTWYKGIKALVHFIYNLTENSSSWQINQK